MRREDPSKGWEPFCPGVRLNLKWVNRLEWAKSLPKNSSGLELGVMWGQFTMELVKAVSPALLYAIDAWSSEPYLAAPGQGFQGAWLDPQYQARNARVALRFLHKQIASGQVRLVCAESKEAVEHVADETLDWIYIDSNHSKEAVDIDLAIWYPKVKKGGLIAGHDFRKDERTGVRPAVLEFIKQLGVTKLRLTRERGASFEFTKPEGDTA